MKSLIRRSATPLGAIVAAFILLVFCITFLVVNRANATDGQQQAGRLITIHDRGVEQVILSEAATVGDALKEAGIELDESDSVEPAVSEQLIADEYSVNIYRARPVIVIDGATKQKIITPYQTGAQIAEGAGITTYPEDITTLARTDDIVSEGAGLKLTIDRATPFTFTLYGNTTEARSQGQTVGDMLKEKGITLTTNDRVVPDKNTPLVLGAQVRVWREGKQTITVDEAVNFTTTDIQDGDQYIGYRATKTPGQAGSRSVTYEVRVQDGREVARTEIASITTKEPVTQVDVVGAKYRGAYTTPTENEIISWNFFIANGFTREQTAGIMGNLYQEHKFMTSDTPGGLGIAQWLGGRRSTLMTRPDYLNIYTQLEYILFELNNKEYRAMNALRAATSVEQATIAFQNQYERCGDCRQQSRIEFAYGFFARYR